MVPKAVFSIRGVILWGTEAPSICIPVSVKNGIPYVVASMLDALRATEAGWIEISTSCCLRDIVISALLIVLESLSGTLSLICGSFLISMVEKSARNGVFEKSALNV